MRHTVIKTPMFTIIYDIKPPATIGDPNMESGIRARLTPASQLSASAVQLASRMTPGIISHARSPEAGSTRDNPV
ncbi:hypothetical protein RRG08_031055 [Elysia crispata]|uniref:Uncharacterized protein n=1 Tax=Elysia crispata TaxID=231223 RepID=A0AAE0ZG14_9GAST|nr:hypothetical protein RRG08_031055 [Elysia crispata]